MIERHSGKASQPSTTRCTSVTTVIVKMNNRRTPAPARVLFFYQKYASTLFALHLELKFVFCRIMMDSKEGIA